MKMEKLPVTIIYWAVALAILFSGVADAQTRQRRRAVVAPPRVESGPPEACDPRAPRYTSSADDGDSVHLLNRAAFGPTRQTLAEVRCMGRDTWLEQQLHPQTIDDPELATRLSLYPSLTMSSAQLYQSYPPPEPGAPRDPETNPARVLAELNASLMVRAVHARAQLEEVLVDFWFNHFNVFAADGPTQWSITPYVRDAIRPHVLGRFEDLVMATAQSPAMLYYLDNYLNVAAGSRGPGSGINENYGRELLELHTVGVDGGYDQHDIIEVSEALTGWVFTPPQRFGLIEFIFNEEWHDDSPTTVMGFPIVSAGGVDEGRAVIKFLAALPATADFIATKLVGRLVSDDPPPSLVQAASRAFLDTGGDLREVVRAILTSEEFYDPQHRLTKVKSPFELVASALRAIDANVVFGFFPVRLVAELGQPMLLAPPPTGWKETADAVTSVGGMLSRFEIGYRLAANRTTGVLVDVERWDDLAGGRLAADRVLYDILQGRAGVETRRAVRRAHRDGAPPVLLAALVLGCPEFQLQ
jgi:uncharacterized protein (DUF1800 family)